ncbi:hypothetical protein B7Z28_01620 [Candidatus Saccharibacteria bacterium 32-45-3]|nr:MAG: hypothetical protein B7Z28_01620 [Candidatus Saccharibacteria bacterium 32-45-3]
MSTYVKERLNWRESMNGVTIDCSLVIAIHPKSSDTLLVTIPGVDGSLDGYEQKYVRMVEKYQEVYQVAAVRMENPFITSHHWESNIRHVFEYIANQAEDITEGEKLTNIKVVAHSAGAAMIAKLAHEYPIISDILLINPAQKLASASDVATGLSSLKGKGRVVFGSLDPSVSMVEELKASGVNVTIIDGADHNFSGDFLEEFINLPLKHLA